MNELVDTVALNLRCTKTGPIWSSNIDLKYASTQMLLCEATSRQCNLTFVGGTNTGTYRCKTGLYGLGIKTTEIQRVINSMLGPSQGAQVYLFDTLIAIRGPEEAIGG